VSYFDESGSPYDPIEVPLTAEGIEQARSPAAILADVGFDRVLTSGLPRTVETALIVAPDAEPEIWPELVELRGGRLSDIPEAELEAVFTRAFHGVVPSEARFLGGETIGALFDRIVPAVERLVGEPGWDIALAVLHGGVNRAIISFALTGERRFLGGIEQAPACLNVLDLGEDWIVRAVNTVPYDLAHASGRLTTMEELFRQYRPLR
jgi:broad specificity phosphatase PhoE